MQKEHRAKSHSADESLEAGKASALVQALQVLARGEPGGGEPAWNQAGRVLVEAMQQWAPAAVWKAFGRRLRLLEPAEVESLVADAIQSLALVASTSTSKFGGQTELSARAWCRRVILNNVANELRARRLRSIAADESVGPCERDALDARDVIEMDRGVVRLPESTLEPQQLVRTILFLRALRQHIGMTHRSRDVESTLRAIWCYLTYEAGATLDEQVRAFDSAPGSRDQLRKRNRIYKLRERGRKALRIACTTDDDADGKSAFERES